MMTEYVSEPSETLQYVLVLLGSCFLTLLLFLCVGRKKSRSSDGSQNVESRIDITNEVNINIVTVSEELQELSVSTDVCKQTESTLDPTSSDVEKPYVNKMDTFELYEPKKNVRDPFIKTEHPYEHVKKEEVTPTENSDESAQYSGSGNAENDNYDNYARVKKVPKKEENAYLVVDIKEPSKNYDMINGGIVKLPVPVENSTDIPKCESNTSDMYAKVDKKEGQNKPNEEEQENSNNSGIYASVTGKQNELTVATENSGNSGYYESCGPVTISTATTNNVAVGIVTSQDAYETISSTGAQNNTYDSVESITDNKKAKKKTRKSSKVKKEKVEKSKGDEHTSHLRNIFKHTKKSRKSDGCVSVEQEEKDASVANKSNSLPSYGKTSSILIDSQRKSIAEIPPPPPSYDKLKHLTELRKARSRTSLHEGASSVESSPRSSPRSADSNINAQDGFTYVKKNSDPWRKSIPCEDEIDESYCTVDSELKQKLINEHNAKSGQTQITSSEEISLAESNTDMFSSDAVSHDTSHVVGQLNEEAAYASVDFERKKRERKAIEFYAVVRKDSRIDANDNENEMNNEPPTYEGTYSLVTDTRKTVVATDHVVDNAEPNYESIESTAVLSLPLPLVSTQG